MPPAPEQADYSADDSASPPSLAQPLQNLAGEPADVAGGGPAAGFAAAGRSAGWRRSRALVGIERSRTA